EALASVLRVSLVTTCGLNATVVEDGGVMDTLLIVAIVLIALAVLVQAGVLTALYLMSKRISGKVESLMDESQKLIRPLELITSDLKSMSGDLSATGKIARDQALHVQEIVAETHENVRQQIADVRTAVQDTIDEARDVAMRPVREYSAIAMGIAAAVRTLFGRKTPKETGSAYEAEPP